MRKLFSLLMLALCPLLAFANWTDPIVVLSQKHYQLDETFKVDYYNAPQNAKLIIYSIKGSISAPEVSVAIAAGKGSIETSVPTSAGKHAYYAAICTGTDASTQLVSEPVLFVADSQSEPFSMTISQNTFAKNEAITVTLKNAPACSGDQVVIYPANYKLVSNTDLKYTAPTHAVSVTGSNCTVTLKSAVNNYFKIYYLFEGKYITLYDTKDIMVGTPATITVSKSRFVPEEDVTLRFTNLSKKYNDKIEIFPFEGNPSTDTPVYSFNMKGREKGTAKIPAGSLPEGIYRAVTKYNDGETTSMTSYARFTVSTANSNLIFSEGNTETYYNIISAADGKCMTTEMVTSTAAQKNMQLVAFSTSNAKNEWRLIKRADGKIDIINRATGDYLLNTSTAQGSNNYTKIGSLESTHTGFNLANLTSDQYSISSIEEDGIKRYLANITAGDNARMLNVTENSIFAWRFVEVETVTGISDALATGASIKAEDGKIIVTGNQNYSIWDAQGIEQNKNAKLVPGIYVVKWEDGQSAKISVK